MGIFFVFYCRIGLLLCTTTSRIMGSSLGGSSSTIAAKEGQFVGVKFPVGC